MRKQSRNLWLGLALIIAGIVPAGFLAPAVWKWSRARSWTAAPATINSLELNSSASGQHGTKGSLKLAAEYQYEWEGTVFHSNAISPFNGIEVFDSYTRQLKSSLADEAKKGDSVNCFVNPDNPSQAVLNRDFRWVSFCLFLAAAIAFSGSGILLVRQHLSNSKS